MASPLLTKFRLKEGMSIRTVNAPVGFSEVLGTKAAKIATGETLNVFHQVHCFVKTKKELEAILPSLRSLFSQGVVFWIYYPKGSSKMQTDLTRDNGWELVLKEPGIRWLALVSFNNIWSAFGFRCEESGSIKRNKPAPRPIPDYIDPINKIVIIPDDLGEALTAQPGAASFFSALAFTHQKEYVEWIVTAKKPETRSRRIQETIKRLRGKLKNPTSKS